METVLRVFILFVFITMALRLIGKRELAEMSPLELVMIMLIPELATQGLNREDHSITNSIIGISTLLSLVFVNSMFNYRFSFFQKIVEGVPVVLFYQGHFVEGAMDRERISADELLSHVRSAGYERFTQIKWIILEADGQLSCIPYEHGQRTQKPEQQKLT